MSTDLPPSETKPGDYTNDVRAAYAALMKLTKSERGLVLCWFCKDCHRHMGPGDYVCHCENDE